MKSKDERLIPFKTIDYLFGLLVFFISFGVYLHTLTPTVGFHDSGELITCTWTLGIAHPPGYPLYTLLGKVFITLIPIGNIAYRMNMESALFASLACMMVYFITLKLSTRAPEHQSTRIIPSIVASLILAFSLTFWEQAVIAEKYTLNALFATLIIFILLKWQDSRLKTPDSKLLYLFSFILGLSFTHHFQTIYLVPASVFFIIATLIKNRGRTKKKPQLTPIFYFLFSIFFFLLPLTLWLYLPLRASQDPVLNWGDPDTLNKFIEHISVVSYKETYFISSSKILFNNLKSHLQFFHHQFSFLILFGIIGFFILLWKRMVIFLFLALIASVNIFFSIHYTIYNIQDYYIPLFILSSIFIGFGFLELLNLFKLKIVLYFMAFILFICPTFLFKSHYYYNNKRKYYFFYDYGRNILKTVEKNAVIFTYNDENIFPVWYLEYVEGMDYAFLINYAFLLPDWYPEQIKERKPDLRFMYKPYGDLKDIRKEDGKRIVLNRFLDIVNNNFSSVPIYMPYYRQFYDLLKDKYLMLPEGIFYRVVDKTISDDKICRLISKNRIFPARYLNNKKDIFKDKRVIISIIEQGYLFTYIDRGDLYFKMRIYEEAECEYRKALTIDSNSKEALYGLGIIYFNKGLYKKAYFNFTQALKIDPNNAYVKQMLEECQKKIVDKN